MEEAKTGVALKEFLLFIILVHCYLVVGCHIAGQIGPQGGCLRIIAGQQREAPPLLWTTRVASRFQFLLISAHNWACILKSAGNLQAPFQQFSEKLSIQNQS